MFRLIPHRAFVGPRAEVTAIDSEGTTATLRIDGLLCSACAATVRGRLERIEGVRSAEVDLESGRALVNDPNVRWFWLEIAWEEPDGAAGRRASVWIDHTGGSYQELLTSQADLPCDMVHVEVAIVLLREPRTDIAHVYVDDVRLELVAPPVACPTPTGPLAPPGPTL